MKAIAILLSLLLCFFCTVQADSLEQIPTWQYWTPIVDAEDIIRIQGVDEGSSEKNVLSPIAVRYKLMGYEKDEENLLYKGMVIHYPGGGFDVKFSLVSVDRMSPSIKTIVVQTSEGKLLSTLQEDEEGLFSDFIYAEDIKGLRFVPQDENGEEISDWALELVIL